MRIINKPKWPKRKAGWRAEIGKAKEFNQLGFRGRNIKYNDRSIVVLLLGDSQVQAACCPFEKMPERRLEKCLQKYDPNFKVFSLGTGGYGNDQQLLVLREYFRNYRADYVLLWQTFSNDVWNNIFPTHWPKDGWIKPTFRLVDGELIGPNFEMGDIINDRFLKLQVLFDNLFSPSAVVSDNIWEQYLPDAYEPLTSYSGKFFTDWEVKNNSNNPLLKNENLENEKSHFAMYLTPPSPRMQYGLDLTRALLKEIEQLCKKNNSKFLIFDKRMGGTIESSSIKIQKKGEVFYRSDLFQQTKNKNYVNQGFTSFEIKINTEEWRCSPTDGHLNPNAIRELMIKLVKNMRKKKLLGKKLKKKKLRK